MSLGHKVHAYLLIGQSGNKRMPSNRYDSRRNTEIEAFIPGNPELRVEDYLPIDWSVYAD
jgi:hypothetical protein